MKETVINNQNVETAPVEESDEQRHLKKAAKQAYLDQKKSSISDEQIVELLPLVNKIAHRIHSYIKPPLSFEDLVSAGTVGLVKAAGDYDPSYQAEFRTYAFTRIKGAILDELRNLSLLPTNVNSQVKKMVNIRKQIYADTGRQANDNELADKLGVNTEKFYDILESARAQHFLSIEGFVESSPAFGELFRSAEFLPPDKQIEREELVSRLAEAIGQLPEKQRRVVVLYYQQELTMKEIAEVLEISEPRISQIHASALLNLFGKLEKINDGQ